MYYCLISYHKLRKRPWASSAKVVGKPLINCIKACDGNKTYFQGGECGNQFAMNDSVLVFAKNESLYT